MKTIAFFNNKGGVGKTSLAYHLASMYADLGLGVIAADMDPQANLSSMFLPEDRLEELWPDGEHPQSILGAIRPILKGTGDIADPHVEDISDNIGLLVGDLGLSTFEDKLSDAWPRCHDRDEAAFRVISAFYRVLHRAAESRDAKLVLMDVGPNLGAINRAAIIAAEHVAIPLASDLFSLQGLRNLGPTLRHWREEWGERRKRNPDPDLDLPSGDMAPAGYVVMQHAVRLDRPVQAYSRWMDRIPAEYQSAVLNDNKEVPSGVGTDPNCLAQLKHYRSLMPLAMEARKPMFFLKPADGAIGAHTHAVQECYKDFKRLAEKLAKRCKVSIP
jgi:cellulose biosynthesis protein BcsQ